MIVSASRRTDIPAFHMDWFAARLNEQYALSQNPMNARQIRRIDFKPEETAFVVWTKNAAPLLNYLDLLSPYPYYIQFTITPYGPDMEPGLPSKCVLANTMQVLAEKIGRERIVWRYDPIIFSQKMNTDWHVEHFDQLSETLRGASERCQISFVDVYRCMRRRFIAAGLRAPHALEKRALTSKLAALGKARGFAVAACCEPDLSDLVPEACCIDAGFLSDIAGRPIADKPDRNQRPFCGCSASVDIGMYDSCGHDCLYCYAIRSQKTVANRLGDRNAASPLLCVPTEDVQDELGG